MNYSENYGFALPEDGDFYDIAPISENFDAIDGILTETESAAAEINTKIGTPAAAGSTLFSLLENNSGGSVIKSIQHKTLSYSNTTKNADIEIDTVDVAKTFVIMERLYDTSTSYAASKIEYSLEATKIHVTIDATHGMLGFWVIEFN